MIGRKRVLGIGVLLASAVGVGAASFAWACTPQAHVDVAPQAGYAGEEVAVEGQKFSTGPVQVHWNSAGGAVLGTGTGPDFTIMVRVPANASPGVYTIVASQTSTWDDHGTPYVATASPATTFTVHEPKVGGTSSTAPPRRSTAGSGGPVAGEAGDQADANNAPAPVAAAPGEPADEAVVVTPGRVIHRSAPAPGGAAVALPSVPGGQAGTPAAAAPSATEAQAALEALPRSARSVAGDLWSGFGSSDFSSAGSAALEESGSGKSPMTNPGVLLLGGGVIVLSVGFLIAEMTRRRVAAGRI